MDPKQTEGQNSGPATPQGGFSFSNGAMPSGTPPTNTTTPGTLSTGANVSRTMDDLNVNDRKSATSNSPFAKHHFDKVAPGTGDILIAPSSSNIISSNPTGQKGINRGRLIQFGLIFGGIALVALVIFTVVMVVNNQGKSNTNNSTANNSSTVVAGDPTESFENFLQKLVIGEVGKNVYTTSDGSTYSLTEVLDAVGRNGVASNNVFYADRLIDYDTSQNRSNYISELSNIIADFSASYTGENAELVEQIGYYYRDFASVLPVLETDLIEQYQNIGYDQAVANVGNTYGFNDDRGINDYNAYSREYAIAILNLLNEIKTKFGCDIVDSESVTLCASIPSAESYQAYLDAQNAYFTTAKQIKQDARLNALGAIGAIYSEYYDSSDSTTDTEVRDE